MNNNNKNKRNSTQILGQNDEIKRNSPQSHEPTQSLRQIDGNKRNSPQSLKQLDENQTVFGRIIESVRGWRLGFSVDGELVGKFVTCSVLLVLFALLETTLFTRIQPLGATPDLMLALTIAVAVTEKEKWGAVFGLASGFVVESLSSHTTGLPLLFTLVGFTAGVLTTEYFRDSAATRALFTAVAALVRAVVTVVTISAITDASLPAILIQAAFPEFLGTVLFSPIPHVAAKLSLHYFNKSREERTHKK